MMYLVNPSERGMLSDAGDRMPLGLLYLATAYSKREPVKVYDLNHSKLQDLVEDIRRNTPERVGISCLTSPMVGQVNGILRDLQGLGVRTIVGGYHPTIRPQDFPQADSVVQGEGENVKDFDSHRFMLRGSDVDLTGLLPDRSLLDPNLYNLQLNGRKCATAITSRGCPNNCVFCGNLTRKVRYSPVEDVAKDLWKVKSQGFNAVYFLDDVFTLNKDRAKRIGQICKALDLQYRVTTRANYTDEELVSTLASTGCVSLSMGVESGNESILERVGKNQTKDQIKKAVTLCNKYGIPTKGFFIIGLPGETEQTARQTLDFARELKKEGMRTTDFYPLIPFPGTEIWTDPDKFHLNIVDTNFNNYLQADQNRIHVPVETYHLTADQIREFIKEGRQI